MFFRLFAFFAFVAVVFASPKPEPQVLTYTNPAVASYGYSPYVAYSAPYAAAAYPYSYPAYYVR